ncbi:hypothetical protein TNCV_5069451 [Trichonephila clavipes]|nr:hypothetical protein TNCV_5069451 [Trichonephila clavipes]
MLQKIKALSSLFGLKGNAMVILSDGQMTRMKPELAPHFPHHVNVMPEHIQ